MGSVHRDRGRGDTGSATKTPHLLSHLAADRNTLLATEASRSLQNCDGFSCGPPVETSAKDPPVQLHVRHSSSDRDLDSFSSASPQQGAQKRCVALYAHGGGYARGEANMYVDYMERWVAVAKESGLDLVFLSVEYRIPALSTESPHPSQVRAFVSTYRKLLDDGFRPENMVFMGDSAGGGLCVLSAIELRKLGLPQPAASVLISPWMDLAMSAFEGGNQAVESDYFVMANEAVPALARQFAGSYGLDSPEVNPLYRPPEDICDLNPQLILVGAAEFALYDSKAWARLCRAAGVSHKLHIEWAQLHIYAMGSRFIDPRARRGTDLQIIEWVKDHSG
ncbi:hypothetical protein FDECE_12515 [Fusarium decemcellulare]|nr:hypothetical protein FDECE_12515 [Fusarium decemcellulare]